MPLEIASVFEHKLMLCVCNVVFLGATLEAALQGERLLGYQPKSPLLGGARVKIFLTHAPTTEEFH